MLIVSSGIDAIRFFSGSPETPRPIDIFSIGRRDTDVHEQFQKLESDEEWLYIYDTLIPKAFTDHRKHRENLSTKMNRSKFFEVNPSKFNCLEDTGGQEEIGFRYFEGATAGTVMIGRIPNNPNFKKHFPWKESVVELPMDRTEVIDFMTELRSDHQRLARICFDNVKGSLERHDFVYRWENILEGCGLEVLEGIQLRKEELQALNSSWIDASKLYV